MSCLNHATRLGNSEILVAQVTAPKDNLEFAKVIALAETVLANAAAENCFVESQKSAFAESIAKAEFCLCGRCDCCC